MADEKITDLTSVTTLPDTAVLTAVDPARSIGDKNVQIPVSDAKTLFADGAGKFVDGIDTNDAVYTTGNVGIGNNDPLQGSSFKGAEIYSDTGISVLKMTNSVSGTTNTDGVELLSNANVFVITNKNFTGVNAGNITINANAAPTSVFQLNVGDYAGLFGSVKIASTASSPDASAQLDVESTTKGFLPPRMTEAQRLAISSPAVGLIVYQTDGTEGVYVNKSGGWVFAY